MSRICYSKYCSVSLRRYFLYEQTKNEKLKDMNYGIVDEVISNLSVDDLAIIKSVYTSDIKSGFNQAIAKISNDYDCDINIIWKLIKKVEKEVAIKKGLI